MNLPFSASGQSFLGIDIGGTKTALSLWSQAEGIREFAKFETSSPQKTIARIIDEISKNATGDFTAIGIACGSPLDSCKGIIKQPPNLPEWIEVEIADRLNKEFHRPVHLLNDANANALSEWIFGYNKDSNSLIYLTAGTGMGAGIILNGQLIEGACGNAGEVGHVRLAANGPIGYGKNASFEGFCSGGGIPKIVDFLPRENLPADLDRWKAAHPDTRSIANSARSGDPTAQAIFDVVAQRLGAFLSVLIDTLNPERIVIGSLFLRCHDLLEPRMRKTLEQETLPASLASCEITPSRLGENLGNLGAICAALRGESLI